MSREPAPSRAPSEKPSWSRREFLRATAGCCAATACARPDDRVLRFWAMGREGEVATQLLRAFEREHPGCASRCSSCPGAQPTRSCSPRSPATRRRTSPSSATPGSPSSSRWTRSSRCDAGIRGSQQVDPARLLSRHLGHQRHRTGGTTACPGTSTRGCCSTAATCSPQAGFAAPPRDWAEWMRMLVAIKERVGRRALRAPAAAQRVRAAAGALRCSRASRCCATAAATGNFREPGLRARAAVLPRRCSSGAWRRRSRNNEIANVWNEFARGYFTFYITGPWNIGEFKRRLPRRAPAATG